MDASSQARQDDVAKVLKQVGLERQLARLLIVQERIDEILQRLGKFIRSLILYIKLVDEINGRTC